MGRLGRCAHSDEGYLREISGNAGVPGLVAWHAAKPLKAHSMVQVCE